MDQDYQTQFQAIEEQIATQKAEMSAKLETLKAETVPQELLDAVETAKAAAAEPMPDEVSKALTEAKEAFVKAGRGGDMAAMLQASANLTKANKAVEAFNAGHGTGKAEKAVTDWQKNHDRAVSNVQNAITELDNGASAQKVEAVKLGILELIRGGRYDEAYDLGKAVNGSGVSVVVTRREGSPAEMRIVIAGVGNVRSSTPKAERDPNAPAPERTTGWSLNGGEIVSKAVAFDACATPEEQAKAAELHAIDAASEYSTRETNYKTTVVLKHGYVKV